MLDATALAAAARPPRRLRRAERGRRLQPLARDHGPGDRRRVDPRDRAAQRRPRRRRVELFRALALPDPDASARAIPHQVSGGQLQRLMAAMALITDPELVIFDEPTTALDVTTQIEVLRAFKRPCASATRPAVYVSHDLAVVAQIADRIIVLRDGDAARPGRLAASSSEPADRLYQEPARSRRAQAAASAGSSREHAVPLLEVRGLIAGYGRHGPPTACRRRRSCATSTWPSAPARPLGVIGESGSGKSRLRASSPA